MHIRFSFAFAVMLTTITVPSFCQGINKEKLIEFSEEYYLGLQIFSVNTLEKIKPPIGEDTTISQFRCLINNIRGSKLFLPSKRDIGILIVDSKEYLVNLEESNYNVTKKKEQKYTAYNKRYQFYPYVETSKFFKKIKRVNLSFAENDTLYILSNESYRYEFDKVNFSLKKMIERGYDKKFNSSWYKETGFSSCAENDSLAQLYLDRAIKIVSGNNDNLNLANEKHGVPKVFERTIFDKVNLRIVNGIVGNMKNKILFLDFFYSSCIPCYKSHPLINRLHDNRDSNFLVIGIDPVLSDTLHIDQFLKRFEIKHPVIIGQDALEISRIPGVVNGYPTFLLIDIDGKVLEYQNGHSEKFLKDIEKKYLSKRFP